MGKLIFKARQQLYRTIASLSATWFSIKLKYLCWKYNGGENIPKDKLPPILVGGEGEALELKRTLHASHVVGVICKHYHILDEDTQVLALIAAYAFNRLPDENIDRTMYQVIHSEDVEVRLFRMMKELEDITDAKLSYFGPPEGFATMEDWLVSLREPIASPKP